MSFLEKSFNLQIVRIVAGVVFSLIMMGLVCADASQKTFSGEIGLRQDYDSNADRVATDEQYESRSRITPRFTFGRLTQQSNFSLTYAPSFVYSYQSEEDRTDHFASVGYGRRLSRRVSVDFDNTYRMTDDPYTYTEFTETGEGDFVLSDRRGRRRYWSNSFSGSTRLEYARDSLVNLGYRNHVLRNRDDDFEDDYTRHTPFASLTHRFNHQWQTQLTYTYNIGNFDNREDLRTHDGTGRLFYSFSPFTRVFVLGGYMQTDYADSFRDYVVYTTAAGFDRELSAVRSLSFETGVSFIQRDNFADTDALYLKVSLDNTIQRGAWSVYGESGVDQRLYTGADESFLSRYRLAGARVNYDLARNLAGTTSLEYRRDENIDTPASERETRIIANVGLAYTFARWYRLSAGYSYVDLDADQTIRSYDNHRVYIGLTAGKELLRW